MYQIRRCKICGNAVHVHAMKKHYVIKNIECDHIPKDLREYARTQDIDKYTTAKSLREILPERSPPMQTNKKYGNQRRA